MLKKKAAVFLLVLIPLSSLSPAMGDDRPPVEVWLGWGIYPGWGLTPVGDMDKASWGFPTNGIRSAWTSSTMRRS